MDPIWNHFCPFYSKYEKKILNNYFVLDFNEKLTTSFSVKFEKRGLQPPVFVKPIGTPSVVPVSNCFYFKSGVSQLDMVTVLILQHFAGITVPMFLIAS